MDRQVATQLICNTFNYPFDEERFRNFVINLLNNVDETKAVKFRGHIKHSFLPHIKAHRRLGTYTDPDGEKIDVLVVQLKNEWALERSRTMLRNFTSDYLKNRDEKDAALVAYYTTNPDDWRFSYIRMEYKREKTKSGKFRITPDITPAKRYSFLVGKNEPNHTAQSQLISILEDDRNNPTLSSLESAFSVDAVTKQFYKDYRSQFEKIWNELNDIVSKDSKIAEEFETKTIDTANFAKKLMGQIVFLYFLQKKGWLGVGKDDKGNFKKWGTGPKNFLHRLFKKEYTNYGNFFNEVLEPLFYEALATEHTDNYYSHLDCKIPFLNGGLFEPLNDYNWRETDIQIDNDLIGDVFKTFDQYNFTVREDEPLEKEVAVDPEMLGKVFENLLPENLRKGKGAYYTPRTIVHYMCQESLINYLLTQVTKEPESFEEMGGKQLDALGNKPIKHQLRFQSEHGGKVLIPKEDIETLIREGDIILELETAIVEEGKKYKPVLMDSIKENAQALDDALANIKVCDPAIGSGAFPVGMLTEIVKARTVLSLYLDITSKKNRTIYNFKRHCIQNSLYGVDIDPGAIEIAKLRLWLSLVVDEDDYTSIQPLPNLDYKIMQGNSLIEEFHGISLDIEKKSEQKNLFAGGSDLDMLIDDLHRKQDDFFNAEHPREKKKKRVEVESAILNIFHNELGKNTGLAGSEKKKIEIELKEITHGNMERNFFPWKLYFADVFREKGGFDVVIANPPYNKERDNKELFLPIRESNYSKYCQSKMDFWFLFLHRSIDIGIDNSRICFITSRYWIQNEGASKIINRIKDEISFVEVVDIGKIKVFDNVVGQHIIALYSKDDSYEGPINYYKVTDDVSNIDQKNRLYYKQLNVKDIFTDDGMITFDPSKINFSCDNCLSDYFEVSQGVVQNPDKVSKKMGQKYNLPIGDGVFVIDEITLKQLNLSKVEKKFLGPFYDEHQIDRYFVKPSNQLLFYLNRINCKSIGQYPNIKNHLSMYKNIMLNRRETLNGTNKYFHLHWPRDKKYFEGNKVIVPAMNKRVTAALQNELGYFGISSNVIISKKNDLKELKILVGILNSNLCQYYFLKNSKKRGVGMDIGVKKIRNFPLPILHTVDNRIIANINQILTTKKANPQADTNALETKIDQLVYDLYGLTEEEIAIVEEGVSG